jgi:hypothetical protein
MSPSRLGRPWLGVRVSLACSYPWTANEPAALGVSPAGQLAGLYEADHPLAGNAQLESSLSGGQLLPVLQFFHGLPRACVDTCVVARGQ